MTTATATAQSTPRSGRLSRTIALARAELAAGHSVIIDRTNADERQRADWLLLARDLRASMALTTTLLVFDVPASVCRARLLQRRDHPTIATPEQALRYVAPLTQRPGPVRPQLRAPRRDAAGGL